jgi:hypothetical protein
MISPFQKQRIELEISIMELRLLIRLMREANPSKSEEDMLVALYNILEEKLQLISQ